MSKKATPKTDGKKVSHKKIAETFAPINSIDRPSATRNFLASGKKRLSRRFGPKKVGLSVGFIVMITLIGTLLFRVVSDKGEDSATNQVKSVLSGDEMKEYHSPENQFTIKMPGFPTVNKTVNKSFENEINITTYERVIENRTKNYTFAVYDYGAKQLTDIDLEGAFNNGLQNKPEIKITSTQKGVYGPDRLSAIEAAYTITDKEISREAHIRYIIKGSRMYAIILIGDNQAKFEEFADSLRFT